MSTQKINLIPGFESYMEDTSVEVNVDVAAPEEVAVEAETVAEEVEEVVETDDEIQEEAEAAEMILAHFDKIDRQYDHLKAFGADRTFLALENFDGSISKSIGMTLPEAYAFDAIGDPNSPESIACQEGFAEAAKSVWEFIKRMAIKIKGFIAKLVNAVLTRVKSLDSNIGRLRKAHSERVDNPEALAKVEVTAYSKTQLDKISATDTKSLVNKTNEAIGKFQKILSDITSGKAPTAEDIISTVESLVSGIDSGAKALKKKRAAAKKVKLSTIGWDEAKQMLDTAASIKQKVDLYTGTGKTIQTVSDQFTSFADKMKTRNDEGGKDLAKAARKAASQLNKLSANFSAILNADIWLASQYTRTAGLRITSGSKKKA